MVGRWARSIVALAMLTACGSTPDSTESETQAESETSADSSTSETSGDGDGDGDGDGCTPPGFTFVSFSLSGYDELAALDLDLICTVDAVTPAPGRALVALSGCVTQNGGEPLAEVELGYGVEPEVEPFFGPGESVRLRYVQVPPMLGGRWFTLRSEPGGLLLLGGAWGPSLLPPASPDFGFEALELALASDGCAFGEHESGCAQVERQRLDVAFDGDSVEVLDGRDGVVGQTIGVLVVAHELEVHHDVVCDDFPPANIRVLFMRVPEG